MRYCIIIKVILCWESRPAGGFSAIRTVPGLSGQIRHTFMQAHTDSEEIPLFLQSFPAGMIHSKYTHTQCFHWCKWEEGGTVELMNLSLTGSSSVIGLWKTDNITSTKILVKCQHIIRFHSHAISITHKFINKCWACKVTHMQAVLLEFRHCAFDTVQKSLVDFCWLVFFFLFKAV